MTAKLPSVVYATGGMLKLVEEVSGTGQLEGRGDPRTVQYQVARYQGFGPNGLPVPGMFKVEGSVNLAGIPDARDLLGADLTLRLQDGRLMRVTIADGSGRVLTEGHGPSRCMCC